jgi:hypothetical protein
MSMTALQNKLTVFAVLIFGVFTATSVLAANDPNKEGGIGGTGTPALHGGIGGTGVRPNEDSTESTLAGKVLFIVGQVEANNLGQTRQLAKGDEVRVGDTLRSGKGATLQLRMEDGGTIVLRPESKLAIESFAYKGKQDGSEHIALSLLAGGFRAVTGSIGQLHKENYSIRTPNATVGIRGTDHETVFIGKTLPGQTTAVEPGTYNHVISGSTSLQSDQGKLVIKPNQTGFAPLTGSVPVLLEKSLPIFGDQKGISMEQGEHHSNLSDSGKEAKNNTETISGKEQSNHSDTELPTQNAADMNSYIETNMSSETQTSGGVTEQNTITQTENVANSTVDISTLESDSLPAVTGSAVVGAHSAQHSVGSAQVGISGEKILLEDGVPTAYSNDTTRFNYVDHQATLTNAGTTIVDGIEINWGVYAGGITFDSSGKAIAIDYHPFAFANGGATPLSIVSAMSGNASFNTVVGSSTVTEQGLVGSSNLTLNVGINLGANPVVNSYNLGVTDKSSRNWTGTYSGPPTPLSTFANGIPLVTTCTCGPASGSAAGIMVGPNAGGLISTYVLSTTNGQTVAGSVVMLH